MSASVSVDARIREDDPAGRVVADYILSSSPSKEGSATSICRVEVVVSLEEP